MNRKLALIALILAAAVVVSWWLLFAQKKPSLSTPQADKQLPKTFISYTDPAGFSFSYPDNLSLVNNEPKSERTYSDITLTAKGLDGNLSLVISDTNFKTLDEWLKANGTGTSKEVKLGGLKAIETTTNNKLTLGAIDQGILFTIVVPLADRKDFWMEVYNQILQDFTFVAQATSEDVIFEGEEIIE